MPRSERLTDSARSSGVSDFQARTRKSALTARRGVMRLKRENLLAKIFMNDILRRLRRKWAGRHSDRKRGIKSVLLTQGRVQTQFGTAPHRHYACPTPPSFLARRDVKPTPLAIPLRSNR